MKMLPSKKRAKPAVSHQPRMKEDVRPYREEKRVKSKPLKRRKRKGWFGKRFKDLAEDIFDVVEDIFD